MNKVVVTIDANVVKKELHLNGKVLTEKTVRNGICFETKPVFESIEEIPEQLLEAIEDFNGVDISNALENVDF